MHRIPRFLKNGANDFLRKPFSREEFFCRVSQNVDQLELIGTLQDLATAISSPACPTVAASSSRASASCRAQLHGQCVAVAMIDIDHFKHINDTWPRSRRRCAARGGPAPGGHHARSQDLIARFGGEEFCLLVPDMEQDEALLYFEELRQRIAALEVDIGTATLRMTVSIGLCCLRPQREHCTGTISEADRQLYLAKAGGRNRVSCTTVASPLRPREPALPDRHALIQINAAHAAAALQSAPTYA
jgi:diguanylate cyclase (GGDEF)-like protein